MSNIQLSSDLNMITAEIKSYKQIASHSIFEIGKRLKHVKEKDLVHGQWYEWLENEVDISPSTATRFVQAYEQLGNHATSHGLSQSKVFEILTLPETVERQEFIETPHEIPSTGEVKTVDDMTVKQLREVTAKAKNLEERNQKLQKQLEDELRKPVPESKTIEVIKTPPAIMERLLAQEKEIESLKATSHDRDQKLDQLTKERDILDRKSKLNESEAKEYAKLKEQIKHLSLERDDITRQIESATALSGLVVEVKHLVDKIAPAKYSRALERLDSDVVINNITEMVEMVELWCRDMRRHLPNDYIDAEVV